MVAFRLDWRNGSAYILAYNVRRFAVARPKDPSLEGKTERIDTRVSPATRHALQAAADAARPRRSLSREIEQRLTDSLIHEGVDNLGPSRVSRETEQLLWALRFLIGRVETMTGLPWWANGFSRDALADAARGFVCSTGPSVPYGTTPPPDALSMFEATAAKVGEYCAKMTIAAMDVPPGTELGRAGPSFSDEHVPERLKALIRWDSDKEGGQ
ncbi:MAG: hypothetical protein ACHP84_05250 [Caulobacterales bacterium]